MAPNESQDVQNNHPSQFNSIQINIVTSIDVRNTLATKSIDGRAFLMDNSPDSLNKGTAALTTVCKQGQVLNWLVYCVDTQKTPEGTWPPTARIVNIAFISNDGENVQGIKVCGDLKVYGGPDKIRSPYTPSYYYYWAGMVLPEITPGLYRYRLVLEFDTGKDGVKAYYQISTPRLRVVAMDA